jgi:hypothetical protein
MPPTKAISKQQNERARALARKLKLERFNDSQVELAAALGVKQPTLSGFLAGARGAGGKIMAGLMRLAPDEAIQISGGVMVDTLSMARMAVDRLVSAGIPRGEAWELVDSAAQSVDEPSMVNYLTTAFGLSRKRPRLPTPPPPMDTQHEHEARQLLLPGRGHVRNEVPAKGEAQRPANVRRRPATKGHRR